MRTTDRIADRVERRTLRWLWSSSFANPWRAVTTLRTAHDRAMLLVRVFYGGALFLTIHSMAEWPTLVDVKGGAPPWPSGWIPQASFSGLVPWILGAYLVASVVVAAVPTWRVARVAYFVTLVQYVSLISAFGGISHNHHAWLWMSGILILLPDRRWLGRTTVQERRYFLNVIWLGQAAILFSYTLTGIWKIVFALHGAVTPRGSTLGLDGFGTIVIQEEMRYGQDPLLSDFLVATPLIGWALFIATMYVEAASLNVAFRPRLHRAWGILLITFHVGTELGLGFTFLPAVAVLAIFLVCSPFAPDDPPVAAAVLDLPLVFGARRWWNRRERGRGRPAPIEPRHRARPAEPRHRARPTEPNAPVT